MALRDLYASIRARFAAIKRKLAGNPVVSLWNTRQNDYALWQAMYDNDAYKPIRDGGMRETIVKAMGWPEGTPIWGHCNPLKQITEAYQNVLRGGWGDELKLAELTPGGQPVNPLLGDALGRLWRMSNLDTAKSVGQRWAALHGTVGIRIAARMDPDPDLRRVWLQYDHPGRIVDYELDDRGNVQAVELEYQAAIGQGREIQTVTVGEYLGRERIYREIDGRAELDVTNELGVCPYVLLFHHDDGGEWGRPAHHGSIEAIHWINWMITNHGDAIYDHLYPTWFAVASGNAPTTIQVGRKQVAYVQQQAGAANPVLQPLVPQLQNDAATNYANARILELRERQPEMMLSGIEQISGQSGETIAKLLMPCEDRIMGARAQYDDAHTRALRIGLSWGVLLSLWDLGSGMGSRQAAETAFRTGLEDFAFAPRPALPPTIYDRVQMVTAANAERDKQIAQAQIVSAWTSRDETLRTAGYTPEQIRQINDERTQEDTIPTTGSL